MPHKIMKKKGKLEILNIWTQTTR